MAERSPRKQIEREAEEHITLGTLLRKRRGERKRAEVRKILAGSSSTAQKIERIRRLDAEGEEEAQEPEGPERPAPPAGAEDYAERQQLAHALQSVKAAPAAATYWRYLLRERGRIKAFGRRTHTLSASLLPPGVRADPQLKGFLAQSLQPWALELARRLQPVLELGWLHLTKRQYNWLVVLKRLCDRIVSTDFGHLNYRDRNLIDGLRRLEALFLLLHYEEDVLQRLHASLRTVFEKKSRLESEYGPTADLVSRILAPEVTLPSLANCLLALNMIKSRRFLSLSDLVQKGIGDPVSSKEFDCPPPIRKKIEEFVESSRETLQTLHEQLVDVRRMAGFLRYEDNGEVDSRELGALYEAAAGGAGASLAADRENLMVFAPRFFAAFDRAFAALLNGSVTVEGAKKETLFVPEFFQTEFTRLRTVTDKLEKAAFGFANFPYKRYLSIRGSSMGAIAKEIEVMQLIDEGLAVMLVLGKSLARLLALNGVGASPGTAEHPLEPSALQGKPFRLPHAQSRLQAPGLLKGVSVAEALERAAGVCFTAGVLFQDPAVFMLFGKESKIAGQLATKLSQLEHLVDERAYEELKLRYA